MFKRWLSSIFYSPADAGGGSAELADAGDTDLDLGFEPDDGGDESDGAASLAGESVAEEETPDEAAAGAAPPPPQNVDPEIEKARAFYARFGSYEQQFDDLIKRGFSPQEAKAEVKATAKDAGDEDPWLDKSGKKTSGYDKWWEDSNEDPKAFRGGLHREIESSPFAKSMRKDFEDFKREYGTTKTHVDGVRGRLMFDEWAAQNPDAAKHRTRILELVNKVGVKDVETALKIAVSEENAKKYEAAVERAKAKQGKKGLPGASAAGTKTRARKGVHGTPTRDSNGSLMRSSLRLAAAEINANK